MHNNKRGCLDVDAYGGGLWVVTAWHDAEGRGLDHITRGRMWRVVHVRVYRCMLVRVWCDLDEGFGGPKREDVA